MASFGEILGRFKSQEDPENLVPLVEDEDLRKGIVAWKSVVVKYKTPAEDCQLKDDASIWNWLWDQIDYDENRFGVVAGMKAQNVNRLLSRLIGLRLIYPDGTINKLSRQYLQSIILRKIAGGGKTTLGVDKTKKEMAL